MAARLPVMRREGAAAMKARATKDAGDVSREQVRPLPQRLDRVIHDRTRLAILAALAASETLSFTDLKTITGTTDGNLSVHARRLEDAGYVLCEKTFAGRTPRTEYRLSAAGRRAFEKYLDHMDALIKATRKK
jgi:DNA-binding transcriptional ArsR family regulator